MIELETIYDPEFVVLLDEGEGVSLLPSSHINTHESRNPFRPQATPDPEEELTPRYGVLPRKLSAAEGYVPLVEAGREKSAAFPGRRISEGDLDSAEPEDETDTSATSSPVTSKSTKEISIKPYLTKMTAELEKYFSKLVHFKGIDESWIKEHRVRLRPQKVPRKTLVLDLDGTLICNTRKANSQFTENLPQSELVTTFYAHSGTTRGVLSFYVRPYVAKLLKTLKLYYEIIVFTASTESYGKAIVEYLDPKNCCIQYLLHRSHCVITKNWIIKDLRVIGRRELKDIIILENSIISFAANLDNGIYIPSYEGDSADQELLPIIDFLKEIADVDDVRPYVKEFAGVNKLFTDYKTKV